MCKEYHWRNGEGDWESIMDYSAEMRDLKNKAVQKQSDGALFLENYPRKGPNGSLQIQNNQKVKVATGYFY